MTAAKYDLVCGAEVDLEPPRTKEKYSKCALQLQHAGHREPVCAPISFL